ncbi:MAG TPA: XRE family transcriptional regulator [Chloroflexota bacterium]|nr:XRE family transcriptional regulator [Chloroflexota bacterium]
MALRALGYTQAQIGPLTSGSPLRADGTFTILAGNTPARPAQRAHKINRIVELRRLSQPDAAALLGIARPKMSNLTVGRLRGFRSSG